MALFTTALSGSHFQASGFAGGLVTSSVNENNLEEVLTAFRYARAKNAAASIQFQSIEAGNDKIALDEINSEIKAVRAKRKK